MLHAGFASKPSAMDNMEEPEENICEDERDSSTGSASLGSSFSSSQDFRRQMRPPNKKKYDEEMEELQKQIRAKDAELKSLGLAGSDAAAGQLHDIRAEKEASINRRKKIDNDLRQLNEDIKKKMGLLSQKASDLHYKNEAKYDEAIRKMQWQLETQNFRMAEERRIVAEIDKLKRSKKLLVEYNAQKGEIDAMRKNQTRMRGERETYYKSVTSLNKREEVLKKTVNQNKRKAEEIKKELDDLYAKKKELFQSFKQSESDYTRHMNERKHRLRKESFKKKEEERKAREENWQKEMAEYEAQREPFEDEKNLCNTLISYLQKKNNPERDEMMLPSPREEQLPQPVGAGLADSLDGGKFVLLKKSEEVEEEYSVANKPRRRSKKGRKLSVTKPLAHTPQIIAQFASLNLIPPSNMSEVTASIEQLQARKRYYEEQAPTIHSKPLLGSLSGSFSSSGSLTSLESPLRERSSTWGFVEVPPAIAESQAPSDAGNSAESGFHDMSRQASKTESSKSADEVTQNDQALEEIIQQSAAEAATSETSRSSSDTITPEDAVGEEGDQSNQAGTSEGSSSMAKQGNEKALSENQSSVSHQHDSAESSVFEEAGTKSRLHLQGGELHLRGGKSEKTDMSSVIVNYDTDFPPALRADNQDISEKPSDISHCDFVKSNNSNQGKDKSLEKQPTSKKEQTPLWVTGPVSQDSVVSAVGGFNQVDAERTCDICSDKFDILKPVRESSISSNKAIESDTSDEAVVPDISEGHDVEEMTHL